MLKIEHQSRDLVNRLVEQFRSKSQYDHFVRQSQEKFDINTYRFQQMTQSTARKGYNQLRQKYHQNLLQHSPRAWHQNQRKLFVWFVLAYLKNLKESHKKIEEEHWQELAETFFKKDILFVKYQFHAIQKNRKRHQWAEQQDQILKFCQQHIQSNNWNQIAKQIFFQTEGKSFKSSKQCRQRWQNHLDDRIKKQIWQAHEDLLILKYVLENGKKWSKIVEELQNTRTEHMVKNRFKSLIAKAENQLKSQKKKIQKQNILISNLIEQIKSKNSFAEKRSSLQGGSEAKDVVEEQDFPQMKVNIHKKSHVIHGVLERGQNGQFMNQNFTVKSSPAPNIFESRSPGDLSASGFLYTHSLFTPQSCTSSSDGFGSNNTFSKYQDQWNKVFKKDSMSSQTSNRTSKFLNCGRREDNIKFSMQLNSLENGEKMELDGSGIPNSYIPLLEDRLQISDNYGQNLVKTSKPLERSEDYTKSLLSNFVQLKESPSMQALSRSDFLDRKDIK